LRIAAWNVEYGFRASAEEIGGFLAPLKPDIVCFSEVPEGDWTKRAGKSLGMEYSFVGKISAAGHKDKYKSTLSRTPIEDEKEFLLKGEWSPASIMRTVLRIEGICVSVYSLHINGPHAVDITGRILPQEKAKNILIAGDFNNLTGSPVMNLFLEAGFADVLEDIGAVDNKFTCYFYEKEGKDVIKYTGSDASAGKNWGVIDHILFNRPVENRPVAGGIIETGRPLSDHKPIWADMEFE